MSEKPSSSPAAAHQPSSGRRHSTRQLRERKQKKLYSEDWALGDEEIEGKRSFSLQEKLEDPVFDEQHNDHQLVKEMHGSELNVAYFQRYGFGTPLLFREKTGLGLRVPTSNFTINDVRMCVGSRRVLDVMDVNTQKNSEMTMKEWQRYYEDKQKEKLLNVISLEFSHTKLEHYVQTPTVVRQVDWVDCVWPRHLKESQTEATNLLEDMKYPKVQKYCLMSVKGCYTDFHVDFGGTSVWYHILKGSKVFWLIPPTERNLALYERWVLSGKQSDIFFGDTVDRCSRITLTEGNTFFIPTGWIHAVYTPKDSLVFGGNFLHSYGVDKQLKIAQVEDTTKVPQKFRYPFFTEMLWYVLERYVHCLLGRSHLSSGADVEIPEDRPHVHLTHAELHGLKEIVMYLHMLPSNKKNVPDLIKNPVSLIQDVRTLIGLHRQDNRELAITGRPILQVPEMADKSRLNQSRGPYAYTNNKNHASFKTPPPSGQRNSSAGPIAHHKSNNGNNNNNSNDKGGPRRRRTRCKKCEACRRNDCGECSFCLDMVKFGGPGRAKQTCNMRQCLQPMLPVTAACAHCGLDGWGQVPVVPLQKGAAAHAARGESASSLMECSVCYEIAHPACIRRQCPPEFPGYINEDMPNSWECPMCCKSGKNTDYRPRHFRARQKSSDIMTMRRMSIGSTDTSSCAIDQQKNVASSATTPPPLPLQLASLQQQQQQQHHDHHHNQQSHSDYGDSGSENDGGSSHQKQQPSPTQKKKRRSSGCEDAVDGEPDEEMTAPPRKQALRVQLAHQLTVNTTKTLKKPTCVVRPVPALSPPQLQTSSVLFSSLVMDKRCLLQIFRHLSPGDLYVCSLVCKTWSRYTVDPSLWRTMDFTGKQITSDHLKGIVRRQPERLVLNWCQVNKYQLPWLIQRLTSLRDLALVSVNVKSVIALRSCHCTQLRSLDLSHVANFNDLALRQILDPNDTRRATAATTTADEKVRLRNLNELKLAGTDVTDISMRYVTQFLPNLAHLILSSCPRITDAGIAQLTTRPANTIVNLISLDLSNTKLVTESSLDHLAKCVNLKRLDLRHSVQVSTQALIKFAAKSDRDLQVRDVKLVVDRRTTGH